MSLIREDDDPRVVRCVLLAIALLLVASWLWADSQRVTLRGRLTATEEDAAGGAFTLDADEIGIVTINPGYADYLRDYLAGSVGHRMTITLEPEP